MTINKKFMIPIPIFIAVPVSVIVATVMMNGERVVDQNNMGTSTNNNELNLEENKMKKLFVTIEGQKLEVKLAENATVSALLKILPLELSMSDLNGHEKYAYLCVCLYSQKEMLKKSKTSGTSLVVHWLRRLASNARGAGYNP